MQVVSGIRHSTGGARTTKIDFKHDSLAEIALKQAEALQERREIIEKQDAIALFLLSENLALKEDADSVISKEHDRLMEALLVVEGWVFRRIQEGEKTCDAEPLHRILTECFAYSEDGVTAPWLAAGRQTLAEAEAEEEEA